MTASMPLKTLAVNRSAIVRVHDVEINIGHSETAGIPDGSFPMLTGRAHADRKSPACLAVAG